MDDNERLEAIGLLLRRLEVHSRLSPEERHGLLELPGEFRDLRARSDFLHARETVEHTCLVTSGLVGRYNQLEDGSRQIVSLHIPGDMVDIYSLMMPATLIPLTTLCAARILRIPHAALRVAIARHPGLALALWRDTVMDASITAQATVNVGRREARARVAHLLCELTMRFRRIGLLRDMSFPLPVTQEQLGDITALTSVHVNRMLRVLREEGLVRFANGHVDILDWPGLQNMAGFDAAYLQSGETHYDPAIVRLAR